LFLFDANLSDLPGAYSATQQRPDAWAKRLVSEKLKSRYFLIDSAKIIDTVNHVTQQHVFVNIDSNRGNWG